MKFTLKSLGITPVVMSHPALAVHPFAPLSTLSKKPISGIFYVVNVSSHLVVGVVSF
jgi:hypothetical protein